MNRRRLFRLWHTRPMLASGVALCSVAVAFIAIALWHRRTGDPADVPVDRMSEPWWAERHNQAIALAHRHPETRLLLIGDSITNNYEIADPPDRDFLPIWNQFYAPRKALNLGFSGDTTSNVLWRLTHGEVDGLRPRVAIVLIGTNNTGGWNQDADETTRGIRAVVAELKHRLPETHILLVGILPSGMSGAKSKTDRTVNQTLAMAYVKDPQVTFLNIGTVFVKNGALDTTLFYDPKQPQHNPPLHPDTVGQRRMAEAIEPTLARLMKESDAELMPF